MSMSPDEPLYEPPPETACEEYVYPVDLDDAGTIRYVQAFSVYRGRTVRFSVELYIRQHVLGDWIAIYRVDTAHGTVHEHRFSPGDDPTESEQLERNTLQVIPREGWETVDAWHTKALALMHDTWEEHVRRWR